MCLQVVITTFKIKVQTQWCALVLKYLFFMIYLEIV